MNYRICCSRAVVTGCFLLYLLIAAGGKGAADSKTGSAAMTPIPDSTETQKILAEADRVFQTRDYGKARDAYQQALQEAERTGTQSENTEIYSQLARVNLLLKDREAADSWLAKAGEIATRVNPVGWARYEGVRGRFVWTDGDNPAATRVFKDLYDFCVAHDLHSQAIDAAHMVAITGTPEEQIEWGLKGIKEAERGEVTSWLGPLWNNLGATYEDQQQYDKALEAYKNAREYHWRFGTESNKMIADWAVGHAYLLAGDLDSAKQWLRPVLSWCERLENGEFIGLTCRDLGEIDMRDGHHTSALDHLVRAERLLKEAGMDSWDSDGYNKLLDRIEEVRVKVEK